MNITKKQKTFKYSTCIMIIILFFVTIFTILGMRAVIYNYNNNITISYRENALTMFDETLDQAIEMGRFGATNSANKIQQDIKLYLNEEQLKTVFNQDLPYPEFDKVLRDSLQKNVYTRYKQINQNRNSMFVILNGKIIASYAHYDSSTQSIKMGYGIDVYEFIEKNFYNPESGYNALDKILKQDNGYIVWQRRNPNNSDIPKVSNIAISDIHDIFLNYGIDALKSFEFLIPVYITEYGDVFGNYDDHTIESMNKDKIIIVQKLNIVDYINFYCPELFDISESDKQIAENYEDLMVMLNIFIVIECLSIVSYAVLFIGYYNHTILIDEMSDKLNPIKEKIEDLFDKDDNNNESPK